MKAGRYRELFDEVNIDKAADEKIKNILRSTQSDNLNVWSINENKKIPMIRRRSKNHVFATFSYLRSAAFSISFLVILAILFISLRSSLLGNEVTQRNDTASSRVATSADDDNIESTELLTDTINNAELEDINDDLNVKETESTDNAPDDIVDALTSETSDIATQETPPDAVEINPAVSESGTIDNEVLFVGNDEDHLNYSDNPNAVAKEGDFYFAWFDVIAENNVKAAIPNLIMRFHGTISTIDPEAFTDIVLTRDGAPVNNGITMTNRIHQGEWRYRNITDFYFSFDNEIREPGNYGLSGKYQGVPFTVYNKIIEASVTDEPADPAAFDYAGFGGYADKEDNFYMLSELCFGFKGLQNAFYQSDLTDLVITCNGEEVAFSYQNCATRYYEANINNSGDTSFNLILTEALTQPGDYILKGKYRGLSFSSCITTIP